MQILPWLSPLVIQLLNVSQHAFGQNPRFKVFLIQWHVAKKPLWLRPAGTLEAPLKSLEKDICKSGIVTCQRKTKATDVGRRRYQREGCFPSSRSSSPGSLLPVPFSPKKNTNPNLNWHYSWMCALFPFKCFQSVAFRRPSVSFLCFALSRKSLSGVTTKWRIRGQQPLTWPHMTPQLSKHSVDIQISLWCQVN